MEEKKKLKEQLDHWNDFSPNEKERIRRRFKQ